MLANFYIYTLYSILFTKFKFVLVLLMSDHPGIKHDQKLG